MSNLVFNPQSKDFFKAKACVAIPRRFNYAGSCRTYRFPYLSFMTWSLSYRAAFCYVLKILEDSSKSYPTEILHFHHFCSLFIENGSFSDFYIFLEKYLEPFFSCYCYKFPLVKKMSIVYKLLDCLVMYNLGEVRYNLISPIFEVKSAIRYAVSKYFPDILFDDIESDFMFIDVMD